MFHVSGEPGCVISDFCHQRNIFCAANSDPSALLEDIRSCEVKPKTCRQIITSMCFISARFKPYLKTECVCVIPPYKVIFWFLSVRLLLLLL